MWASKEKLLNLGRPFLYMEEEGFSLWFQDVDKKAREVIGEKAWGLAEMYNAGFPVPPGFVITHLAFKQFLEENGIKHIVRNMLKNVDSENMQDTAEKIQGMIMNASVGGSLRREIIENYSNLNVNLDVFKMLNGPTLSMIKSGRELPYVAVRGSLVAEAAAGLEKPVTYLNVRGGSNIIKAMQACWASLYSYSAMMSRAEKSISQTGVAVSIIIQRQINSEKSGVVFTSHGDEDAERMLIEAGFGYGEAVVLNQVNPDKYFVDKGSLEVKEAALGRKEFMYTRDETMEKTKKMKLDAGKAEGAVLNLNEIKALGKLGNDIEKFYNNPRDIEFGIENGKLYVIQCRPYLELKKPYEEALAGGEELAGVKQENVKPDDNSGSLFKMFDEPVQPDNMQPEIVHIRVEDGVEGRQEGVKDNAEDRVIANIAGVRIEMPKTKEGLRIAREILELIEKGI